VLFVALVVLMSKLLYFDCFSGISGDMVLGALLDAGLPLGELRRALGSLAVSGYDIDAKKVLRSGVSATKFIVTEHDAPGTQHSHDHPHEHPPEEHANQHGHAHEHPAPGTGQAAQGRLNDHGHEVDRHHDHRSLPEISALIDASALSATGRARAKALFQRLAEAEASIHQMPVEQVHLHEVGALDSIIDIVGAVFGLEWFGADTIVCSPLNVGGGTVRSAHGVLPVPAPATARLLGDAPIYGGAVQQELVTPTGALIATSYASSFGAIPPMTIERIGYGAGDRDVPSHPNVLRVLLGRTADRGQVDRVTVIECEIDDMNPQIFGVAMDRLYAAGALDVFYVPVQMKKNRPGTLLTVVAPPDLRERLSEIVFRETTTIGLRYSDVDRECLQREMITVETPVGAIRFKIARRDGRVINAAPEFEDVARRAAEHNLAVKDVQALAVRAYGDGHPHASRGAGSGGPAGDAS
jgi:uncharacterized protein (TIGR00299 family) protein